MGKILLISLLLVQASNAWSRLLVIEMESQSDFTATHADDVAHIACRGLDDLCRLIFTQELLMNEYDYIRNSVEGAQVVNLSLGFQAPRAQQDFHEEYFDPDRPTYAELMREYKERKELSKSLMNQNPETLFVAAAGNGYNLGMFYTAGVPLSEMFTVYPAIYTKENMVTVASVSAQAIDLNSLENHSLTEYSNYSIHSVDLAAPVELNNKGGDLQGTSFAAPFISRLSVEMLEINPELRPQDIKRILMMSSYVIGLDRAIEITEDWLEKGEDSLFGRLEKIRNFRDRNEMLEEIGEVMLVRSGGPIIDRVARQCASNLRRTPSQFEEACLDAQRQWLEVSEEREAKLRYLWALRDI